MTGKLRVRGGGGGSSPFCCRLAVASRQLVHPRAQEMEERAHPVVRRLYIRSSIRFVEYCGGECACVRITYTVRSVCFGVVTNPGPGAGLFFTERSNRYRKFTVTLEERSSLGRNLHVVAESPPRLIELVVERANASVDHASAGERGRVRARSRVCMHMWEHEERRLQYRTSRLQSEYADPAPAPVPNASVAARAAPPPARTW